jgi:drug/metabolite transporter (DMT)-like permease
MRFYAPIVAAVLGNVLYHSSQRLTPAAAPPFLTVGLSFGAASALCLLMYAAGSPGAFFTDIRLLSWTTLGLGFSIVIIETAVLMAYRLGWPVGITGLVVCAGQTAVLLPLGWYFLGERLAPSAWAGIALCLGGLALIAFSRA